MARPRTRGVVFRDSPPFALEQGVTLHHRSLRATHAPVAFIGRRPFTQHHNLPYAQRQTTVEPEYSHNVPLQDNNEQVYDTSTSMLVYSMPEAQDGLLSRMRRRRATQWKRWQEEFIPQAIKLYMVLMESTNNLWDAPPQPHLYDCKCDHGQALTIKVIRFSAVEEIVLYRCDIHMVGLQLLQRGLFPCAPVAPSLAVDKKLLEFSRSFFLRVSPNMTAMSTTLEDCLGTLGYKLETVVSVLFDE